MDEARAARADSAIHPQDELRRPKTAWSRAAEVQQRRAAAPRPGTSNPVYLDRIRPLTASRQADIAGIKRELGRRLVKRSGARRRLRPTGRPRASPRFDLNLDHWLVAVLMPLAPTDAAC